MIDVRFVDPDLQQIEALKADVVCLMLFSDIRPFKGAAGQIDWRLCGLLSKLSVENKLRSISGEQLLIADKHRLSIPKILLWGLGSSEHFTEKKFEEVCTAALRSLSGLGVHQIVLNLPGRAEARLSASQATTHFLSILEARPHDARFILIEAPEEHKALKPLIERAKQRHRSSVF